MLQLKKFSGLSSEENFEVVAVNEVPKNNGVIFIAFFAVIMLAVNAGLGFVLSNQSKTAMKTLIRNRMLDISNTAADMLDGDDLKSLKAEDKGTPPYQKINDTLAFFQNNIELKYIYCIKIVGEKEFAFSVDPTLEDPGEFDSPIVYTDALYKASKGKPAVDEEPYSDAWGRFYSAYCPVFDSKGEVGGIVAVDFDAKWYDDQIEKQIYTIYFCMAISLLLCMVMVIVVTRQLRQRVKDMTQDLTHALEAAQVASRAKTAFLSSMSHEIRTPMNAIIGLDHIALENPNLPDITREQLKKINASAKHLLGIINDILDVSRIESGKMVLKAEEFNFSEMLEQVNAIIGSQCKDKSLNYECKIIDKPNDFYIGDAVKLRQVLINILGNAVKFTPEGGNVTLKIEEAAKFDSKSVLCFKIIDTGVGMSKEYLPKIFESFSQENSSAVNKYGSTGLGMTITKGLVEMMNGTISVESEKGVGTTFTVTITLKKSSRSIENKSEVVEVLPKIQADLSGKRILLAEDMPINAEILAEVLKMRDMEIEHAENGKIAVEMFEKSPPNYYAAILMDMQMPLMNGLEATQAIRALNRPDAKNIPIIALTANAFDEDVQQSLQAGMNAHLSKPVDPEKLYQTLEEFVK